MALIEKSIVSAVVMLIGAVQYAIPALTRPDVFFAVTVQPDFRSTAEGMAIQRRYRSAVGIHAIVALILTFVVLPAGIIWQLIGTMIAYLGARRRVLPHATTPSTQREATLGRRGPAGGAYLLLAGPIVILIAVAAYLRMHWSEIPPRFAIHWDLAGHPNGWATRATAGVYIPLILAAVVCVFLGSIAVAISHARSIHTTGAAGAAEARFRRVIFAILTSVDYVIALVFAIIAVFPLRHDPTRSPSAVVIVVPMLLVVAVAIIVSLRLGQGGSRLAPATTDEPSGRPAGDRTLDRYWKAGIFYVNRDDPAWLVEKRFGIGYTLNFGSPRAWIAIGVLVLFILLSTALPALASAQSASGGWQGTLDAGGAKLRVVLRITASGAGLGATMDSPDQYAYGLVASSAEQKDDAVTIVFPFGGRFEGKIRGDGSAIDGIWSQNGHSSPLLLTRTQLAAPPRRPQEPVKPYSYHEVEASIENRKAGITLAGTLTLPSGNGPFPAVLLITGSGPQDRDEAIMNHRPFLVWADYLTRKGIAVLRVDDRGWAKSGGQFATATTADFATDAAAAVAWLRGRSDIDHRKIGLLGHSDGASAATMVAADDHDIAFVVMLAGPGVPGDEVLIEQTRRLAPAAPEIAAREERDALTLVKNAKDDASLKKALHERFPGVPEAQLAPLFSPWMRFFISYDPATALRKVRCPVLALNGSKDIQISAAVNLAAIKKANERATTQEIAGVNHLFQRASTGAVSEYDQIEETVSPPVLEIVAQWVLRR